MAVKVELLPDTLNVYEENGEAYWQWRFQVTFPDGTESEVSGEIPFRMFSTVVIEDRGNVAEFVGAYIQRIVGKKDSPERVYRLPNDRKEIDVLEQFLSNPARNKGQ